MERVRSKGSSRQGKRPNGAPASQETLSRRCEELERRLDALREEYDRLEASEAHYRALSEGFHDLIIEIDAEGQIVYASPRLREALGYEPDALSGHPPFDLVHPDDREGLMEAFGQLMATGVSSRPVYRTQRADGQWHWVESSGRVFRTPNGKRHAVIVTRDLAGREEMKEALDRSEERYRTLLASVHDLVAEIDQDGRVIYVSPSVREVLGYSASQTAGANALDAVHPDDIEAVTRAFRRTLETGKPVRIELRYRHRDRSWRWLEAKGRPFAARAGRRRWVLVGRDVTERVRAEHERRQLEAQIQQSQKLESLGILAGGIAHDFNNLLTSILGYADLAVRDLEAGSSAHASVVQIREAGQRAADLTRQLLAYAGGGRTAIEAVDLSSLVGSMIQLLKVSVSKKAKLEWDLSSDVPAILGDSGQISQVVLNLIINASDAIGDREGSIVVRTGVADIDHAYFAQTYLRDELPEGRYAFVEVEDSGAGMDEETKSRIFDPFFTTKFRGRGLGLSAVLGIVRAHGGTITVESEVDRGSMIRVLFPLAAVARLGSIHESRREIWRGGGRVLVVDDEPGVRSIAARMLSLLGFEVTTAENGQEALERLREQGEKIGLVLLDLKMPRMDGEEALLALRKLQPDLPVVLMSGYADQDRAAAIDAGGGVGFVSKPFTLEDLERALRPLLADRQSTGSERAR